MDLLTIVQTIRRHKLVTIPVIFLMLVGVVYVMMLKAPVYKTSGNFGLFSPPPAPTGRQIARDPALGRINTNNPYANWGNLSYVSSLLTATVTSNPVLGQLEKEGVDPRFTVGPNMSYPLGTPIVQVTGIGSSAAEATRSVELVGQDLGKQFDRMQAAQGTDPRYFIKVQQLGAPGVPQEQLSSKLRTLIAVIAVGVILLFVAVSTMTALEERRARRAHPLGPPRPEDGFLVTAPTGSNRHSDEAFAPGYDNPSPGPAVIQQSGNGKAVLGAETLERTGVQPRGSAMRRKGGPW